ncbi:MAG TPA: hypothetical protein VF524_08885 [Polyangia bacterium]
MAIADHVTGRLISAVDLDRWLRKTCVPTLQALGRGRGARLQVAAVAIHQRDRTAAA